MFAPRCLPVLLAALTGFASVVATCADADTGEALLSAALEAHRLPLEFDGARLHGPGAERLLADARAAQFVLVGEDHGFAEPALFTQALYRAGRPTGFGALVLEIGPLSAARAEAALREDCGALARLQADYPFALPFLSWSEYAALASAVVCDEPTAALAGVDQEFEFSPRLHFARLVELAPNPEARRLAEDYARRDRVAYRAMVEKHDPRSALLPQLADADFSRLRRAFAGAAPEALRILDALDESARIYRAQTSAPDASNRARADLMKRNFMALYTRLSRQTANPRVLVHMGAYHVGRGLSPTHQFDLGNLMSELAASQGARSYHVLLLAAGGSVNRWLPFVEDSADKKARYAARDELVSVGAVPLLGKALPRGWTLFDLVALRQVPGVRKAGGPEFAWLVDAYDAVVLIGDAQAARNLGD